MLTESLYNGCRYYSTQGKGGTVMSEEMLANLKPPHERRFKTLKIDALGNINTEEGYDRAVEPIPKLLEQMSDMFAQLPDDNPVASVNFDVKFPLSISCQWVVCQFHELYPNVTLRITDQHGKVIYLQGDQVAPEAKQKGQEVT
ncbi:deaminase domain-containing protein [Laceyella putida]|uniref:Deaminase domain-containing protein n=1 Tax=Laceyella putida TaxID=110101 RepID=A0ABW2RIE4_9BACL